MRITNLRRQASVTISLENFPDGVDVRGSPHVEPEVVLCGRVHDGLGRALHGVVEAGVDNVLLRGAGHSVLEAGGRRHVDLSANAPEPALQRLLNGLKKVIVGLPLILEGEATVRDMVEILQPLKVRHGDTAGVDVHVRDNKDALVSQDVVSLRRDGSVGSFRDDLCLDLVRVFSGNCLFHCSGNEDVALLVHELVLVFVCLQE